MTQKKEKKKRKKRLWKRREPGKGEGSKGSKGWERVGKDIRKLRRKSHGDLEVKF